jgi:hypothetical protein
LATANKEHNGPEEEHQGSPNEVEVDVEGLLVNGGVASDYAVYAHDAADDEEDEAEWDADVESHVCAPVVQVADCQLRPMEESFDNLMSSNDNCLKRKQG